MLLVICCLLSFILLFLFFFFFNDTATTEIYTLSLHDALPISEPVPGLIGICFFPTAERHGARGAQDFRVQNPECRRSEEHTSELQSPDHLVCRLLLEKKKKKKKENNNYTIEKLTKTYTWATTR